jgi:hypothetical protein
MGGGELKLKFFGREKRGQFVVNTWFLCKVLLVGNDVDKTWGECA